MTDRKIILGSASPRRHFLMKSAGFEFEIRTHETDESFPTGMPVGKIGEFIAVKKAGALTGSLQNGELLLTADTTVIFNHSLYGKPLDMDDASRIIRELAGKSHIVITGVCLKSLEKEESFSVSTEVFLDPMTAREIDFYVKKYNPIDKAGAYGIQEWIGWNKVSRINGSYTNVMGLPMSHVYHALMAF